MKAMRLNQRERQRRKRAERRIGISIRDAREAAILATLVQHGRVMPTAELARRARQEGGLCTVPSAIAGNANPFLCDPELFLGRSSWTAPTASSIRRIVHRVIDRLQRKRLVSTAMWHGKRGFERWVEALPAAERLLELSAKEERTHERDGAGGRRDGGGRAS